MKILYLFILTLIASVGIFSQINLLSNVEARSIAAFDWRIDEQYTRNGFVDFIVSKGSHNSLPVTIRSISSEPIMLILHTTYNFDQTGPAKLPSGVDAFFEPTQFRLEPNQSKQVELVINVDESAPSNLYDLQIIGTWEEEGKTPDFMGSSIRLHVGRDFGLNKIPVNMLDPPLKFWKYAQNDKDVTVYDTPCRNDYVLVVKAKDGLPACVKPETKTKLIERGWAKNNLDKIPSGKEIPSDYDSPGDFRVTSTVNGLTTLDTQKNLYLPDMCDPPIEFKLDLSPKENQQIWQSIIDNNFFELGGFNSECGSLENCLNVSPEIVVTLTITADGKTHSVTHLNSYIKTKDDGLDKFENVVETLGEIVLRKNKLNNFTAPRCGLQ